MLDPEQRRRVFSSITADLDRPLHRASIASAAEPLEAWTDGSPLMHVRFE